MALSCSGSDAGALFGDGTEAVEPDAAMAATGGSAGSLCAPGSTQGCLGPGACRGAQDCSASGSAWLTCDCGREPGAGGEATGGGSVGGRAIVPGSGGQESSGGEIGLGGVTSGGSSAGGATEAAGGESGAGGATTGGASAGGRPGCSPKPRCEFVQSPDCVSCGVFDPVDNLYLQCGHVPDECGDFYVCSEERRGCGYGKWCAFDNYCRDFLDGLECADLPVGYERPICVSVLRYVSGGPRMVKSHCNNGPINNPLCKYVNDCWECLP